MVKINDEIKKMFKEKKEPGFIATLDADDKINLSCKGSLNILDDEHLFFSESTGKKTYNNLLKNPNVSVAIASRDTSNGYQLKGKAELVTEGPFYEMAVKNTEEASRRLGRQLAKPIAAVRIKVDEIYSLKSGPGAGERIS
ncbi:MAG: pyridoxamine 5'-phosphate oxidase family protein [Methanobacteriota archaeon]